MYGMVVALSCLALISVFAQYRNAGMILVAAGMATYIGIRKLGYEEVRFLRTGTLLRWYDQVSFSRLFFAGLVDVLLIMGAYWLSFVLKYEFDWGAEVKAWYLDVFPLTLLSQFGVFLLFGLYRGVWRVTGIGDLLRVLFAVGTAVALSYAVVLLSVPPSGVLSFFCIDLLVLAAFAAGVRCLYRILDYTYQCETASGDGAVIYGAGRGGQLVVREMLQNAALGLRPVGFIDDDPRLWRRMIQRVQVFGSVAELASVLERYPVGSVVISSEKIRPDCLAQALSVCSARQVPVLRAHLKLEPIGPNGNGGEYGEALSALVPATQPGLSRPVEDGKM